MLDTSNISTKLILILIGCLSQNSLTSAPSRIAVLTIFNFAKVRPIRMFSRSVMMILFFAKILTSVFLYLFRISESDSLR